AGLGAPSQGAQPGARCVDEDPAVGAGFALPQLAAVTDPDLEGPADCLCARGRCGKGGPHELGAVWAHLVGDEVCPLLQRKGREESGFPARTGTQIEPPLTRPAATVRLRLSYDR